MALACNFRKSDASFIVFFKKLINCIKKFYVFFRILILTFNISENIENTSVQVLSAFSQGLFVNYIYAFELIALILTIIVVGITLFDKKEDK